MITQRRRRRASEAIAEVLLDAALVEFAAHGFDGATTRAIAHRAGAHQPQINYHFASKELLWRAAVDHLFGLLAGQVGETTADDTDPVARFTDGVRRFVRFSAQRPELHRIMNLESTAGTSRLEWIVDNHVGPLFDVVRREWEQVRATGIGTDLSAVEVWLLLVGFGAIPFANAPVVSRFGGPDPADAEQVERHTDRLLGLLGLSTTPTTETRP
jgi:TetR/AcrR family transcriptional regulator